MEELNEMLKNLEYKVDLFLSNDYPHIKLLMPAYCI
jgi:hypothetical protein